MFKAYLKNFSEPSINSWKINEDQVLISPIKNQYIDIHKLNWSDVSTYSHSEILWFYSLGALVKSAIDLLDVDISEQLQEFHDFQVSPDSKYLYDIKFNHSYDHCMAVRVRYLCLLLANRHAEIDLVHKIIQTDLDWFLSIDSVPKNNHGMMVCISVLHACVFLEETLKRQQLVEKASKILIDILSSVVPDNYYVYENTIGYHEFYVKSLKNIHVFLLEYNLCESLTCYVESLLEHLEHTLYQLVYPDGGLPPVGQCGSYPTKYQSIAGKFVYNPQGFFVFKDMENYLSFICGFASTIHKQIDDTSILLKIGEEAVFLDCGLGSYDHRDSKAKVINGQRGHSGAFFKKFDHWSMWEFFSSKKIDILEMSLAESNSNIIGKKIYKDKDYKYNISRELAIRDFYDFSIIDTFDTDDSFAFPVSRFILPEDVNISCLNNVLLISYKTLTVKISIKDEFNYSIIPSCEAIENMSAAFISSAYGVYHNAITLELMPSVSNILHMDILIEKTKE